jgi:SagB-type dehydrogenase family enzyme
MLKRSWQEVLIAESNPNHVWELFHENSKTSRIEPHPPDEFVVARMREQYDSLPYDAMPEVALPEDIVPMRLTLADAMISRTSCREMRPAPVTLAELGTMLYCAYGVNRSNEDSAFPRPFRTVPSGGGLYPLEIYFHTAAVEGLAAGLYHYNAVRHRVYRLRDGDFSFDISNGLIQPNLAVDASVLFFFTAIFERSVFKYGDRGYRFVLMEAGHAAQNLNLAAAGLGFGALNVGGFVDRTIDEFLAVDGVTHSTVYIVAAGKPAGE